MEELGEHSVADVLRDRLRLVNGLVAVLPDQVHLREHLRRHRCLEDRIMEAGGKVALVGHLDVFDPVEPLDDEFDGAARVEAGGARVEQGVALGLLRLGV